ncbi:Plasma membrane proteolipid 3 [Daldinia childiae]|uniref:Plasma membrane proteolipid 3 n=1 Tax=Daldinia childiae TaxID=326645 RepID=UPI001448A0A9|nr:Plasma membrane proteolipid 3 [Daldinia childiae]KAF3061476.1 Plasma membrane proteolipid 3 [Daldinia childiae]
MCSADLFLGLLAILFPPLPVWVKTGLCSADSIINILLCLLGYLPGTIHAWYIISKFPESYEYEAVPQDSESARVTYIFVQEPQPQARPQAHPKSASNSQPNYGATDNSSNHHNNNASSSSAGPSDVHDDEGHAPPTYAEAVKGDHKIQTHD